MSGRIRAGLAVARWSALTTQRRALNRMWDAVGWAAGYCMATTWRQDAAAYGMGFRQWRCWVLRSKHAGPHRTGSYAWRDGQPPVYDPVPGGHHAPVPGQAPRWIRARHYNVGTRRRDRLAVRHAFEVLQARSQRRLSEAAAEVAGVALEPWQADAFDRLADEVLSRPAASDAGILVDQLTTGELGHVPFTRPPEDEADRIAAQMRALQDRVNQAKTHTIVYGGAGWGDAVVSSVRLHDGPTWKWVPDGRGGWTSTPRNDLGDLAADVRANPDRYSVQAFEVMPDGTRVPIVHDDTPATADQCECPKPCNTESEDPA